MDKKDRRTFRIGRKITGLFSKNSQKDIINLFGKRIPDKSDETRKSFHFDLDTKLLKEHYDSGKNYTNAYKDICKFLQNNGFKHEQGSGYTSQKAMSDFEAVAIAFDLKNKFKWFGKCVRVFTITDYQEPKNITKLLTNTKSEKLIMEAQKISQKEQLSVQQEEPATISMKLTKENAAIAQEIYDKSPKQQTRQNKRSKNEEL